MGPRNGRSLPPGKGTSRTDMDQLEANFHPFILRIWLEESVEEAGRAVWRGHITHVPSGKRRHLRRLNDIAVFVAPYLERMGVKLGLYWRVRRWLNG